MHTNNVTCIHYRCIIIIIIKAFLKRKILSLETILSAHTHTHKNTHTHTHRGNHTSKHSDYTKLNIHSLKHIMDAWIPHHIIIKMHYNLYVYYDSDAHTRTHQKHTQTKMLLVSNQKLGYFLSTSNVWSMQQKLSAVSSVSLSVCLPSACSSCCWDFKACSWTQVTRSFTGARSTSTETKH